MHRRNGTGMPKHRVNPLLINFRIRVGYRSSRCSTLVRPQSLAIAAASCCRCWSSRRRRRMLSPPPPPRRALVAVILIVFWWRFLLPSLLLLERATTTATVDAWVAVPPPPLRVQVRRRRTVGTAATFPSVDDGAIRSSLRSTTAVRGTNNDGCYSQQPHYRRSTARLWLLARGEPQDAERDDGDVDQEPSSSPGEQEAASFSSSSSSSSSTEEEQDDDDDDDDELSPNNSNSSNKDSEEAAATITGSTADDDTKQGTTTTTARQQQQPPKPRVVAVIGAGWGGLSAAHRLSRAAAAEDGSDSQPQQQLRVVLLDAAETVGGLVRDGYQTTTGSTRRPAEAGQHGFWHHYCNIRRLLRDELDDDGDDDDDDSFCGIDRALSELAEQGQYSQARGLEAVWPVYRDQVAIDRLPTGMPQALSTRFTNLPVRDRLSAAPLVLAVLEFLNALDDSDDGDDADGLYARYDRVSFRDLCRQLGVSRRCYEEVLEPMVLTGLFAPGAECSAAAALGMAHFFVLRSPQAFDVQWCRGNVGDVVFRPWLRQLQRSGRVEVRCRTRVTGFRFRQQEEEESSTEQGGDRTKTVTRVAQLECTDAQTGARTQLLEVDDVIFAVGAPALRAFARCAPELVRAAPEFRRFANLRGTSCLATRLFLDRPVTVPYTANACWGFDRGVGMTFFDIAALHGRDAPTVRGSPGSVLEVDYYHASSLLVLDDDAIVAKAKADLDTLLGADCRRATVVDAAVVRLPDAVNWYFPGSHADLPDLQSRSVPNVYFAGDIVRTHHGSWSQEKAFVTGVQAANLVLGRPVDEGVIPLPPDERHVKLGRDAVRAVQQLLTAPFRNDGKASNRPRPPSLVDFLW